MYNMASQLPFLGVRSAKKENKVLGKLALENHSSHKSSKVRTYQEQDARKWRQWRPRQVTSTLNNGGTDEHNITNGTL